MTQGVEHNRDKPVPTHEAHAGPWLPGAKSHDWRPRIWTSLPSKAPYMCSLCWFQFLVWISAQGTLSKFLKHSANWSAPVSGLRLVRQNVCSIQIWTRMQRFWVFALAEVVKIQEKAAERKAPPNNTWMNKHMEYAEQLGVRWATPLPESNWSRMTGSPLWQKGKEIVWDCRVVVGPTAEFRNLSQSVGRAHGNTLQDSGKHVAPTMLPGQVLWTESQDRLLSRVEAMILQGYPIMPLLDRLKANGQVQVRLKENFTESFLTDLAGNAMALPVVLAIFQAGMAAVGFKQCCASS